MGLIKAKCTECGSPLQVQEGSKKAKCPHCGNIFLVEDAVNNYNYTYNTTNNFKADVINVINQKDEFVIKGGTLTQYLGESDVVVIPNTVKRIGGYQGKDGKFYGAFEGTGITEVTFPESLKEIGKQSFKDCEYLKKVNAPYKLDLISEYAFFGAKNIDTLDLTFVESTEFSFNGAIVKQLNLTSDFIMTTTELDLEYRDTDAEYCYVIADKATLNADEINMFYAGPNCEVTLAKTPTSVCSIIGDKLIAPNLQELVDLQGEYYFNEVEDMDGNTLSQVIIDSDSNPIYLFPYIKDLEVYTKKKAKRCPICGSEEISGLSHKCKKCNAKIIHGIKKANK